MTRVVYKPVFSMRSSFVPDIHQMFFMEGKLSAWGATGLMLDPDGGIVGWSSKPDPIVSDIPAGIGYTRVLTFSTYAFAIAPDTSIASWGSDRVSYVSGVGYVYHKQITNKPTGTGFKEVCGGEQFAMALRIDGSLVVWGDSYYTLHRLVLTNKPTSGVFVKIALSSTHAYAMREDGSIAVWGSSAAVIGGDGVSRYPASSPPPGNGYTHFAVNSYGAYVLAVRANGTLYAWGDNSNGLVSQKPTDDGYVAVYLIGGMPLALKADGSIVTWGTYALSYQIPEEKAYRGMSLFPYYALRSDGKIHWTVMTKGDNSPTNIEASYTPIQDTLVTASSRNVAIGANFFVALTEDGSIVCWGRNDYGQISGAPAGNGYVAVAVGNFHCMALHSDGSLAVWGYDVAGAISTAPTGSFVSIAAAGNTGAAVRDDGSLVVWGSDIAGLVATPPSESDFVAVAMSMWHIVALKQDGSIVSWVSPSGTQTLATETPSDSGYTHVYAGHSLSAARKEDGTLVTWGTPVDMPVSTFSTMVGLNLAAINTATVAYVRSDGRIVLSGQDSTLYKSIPSDVPYIGAWLNNGNCLLLKEDGSYSVIGDDSYGQKTSRPAIRLKVG